MARGQSERLMPMILEVMAEAGLGFEAIDAIAVTLGPGGFTGVRIGLAAARGLALARARPLVGIGSFSALAATVPAWPPAGHVVAAIESKRAEIYLQTFAARGSDGVPVPHGSGRAVSPADLAGALPSGPVLMVGDGAARAVEVLVAAGRAASRAPDPGPCIAASVARLAAARALPSVDTDPPRPIYLRGADVTLPDGRKVQAPSPAPDRAHRPARPQ